MKNLSDLIQKLQAEIRQLEIFVAIFDKNRLYEVFETDADLIHGKLLFQSYHKDIAETFTVRLWNKSAATMDLMLFEHTNQEPLALFLSDRTKRLRNECQH